MPQQPPMTEFEGIPVDSYAERPGGLTLSEEKLRRIHPELFGFFGCFHVILHPLRFGTSAVQKRRLRAQLMMGDAQPAVVIQTRPLIVAVHSDDMDCVVMLQFPQWLIEEYNLEMESRLLSVNGYRSMGDFVVDDLTPGPKHRGKWSNIFPVVADFITDDLKELEAKKREIDENDWADTLTLGLRWLRNHKCPPRDGRPLNAGWSRKAR